MKRIGAILAMLGFVLQAHAVQDIKLTETPPLQPLRWCKHSDGQVIPQSEACSSDTTEVSSISQRQPDGHVEFQPLDKKDAPAADQSAASNSTAQPAAAEQMSPEEKKQVMKDFRMRMLKWLGFALVVAVIAKLLKRSFFLWFILGFILRMVLVAANVIAF